MNIIVASDFQVGSTLALWPENGRVSEGGGYTLNSVQKWLWECYLHMLQAVGKIKPDVLVLDGDLIQGNPPRDKQLVSANLSIQARASYQLLAPLRSLAGKMYVIRGTGFHDGACAETSEMLTERLDAVRCSASGEASWWELWLDMGGPVAHFAHTVGMTRVSYGLGTAPLRDALTLIEELRRYSAQTPDLRVIVRAHRHKYSHIAIAGGVHALVCPCWQMRAEYSYAKGIAMLPDIGWLWLEWDGSDLLVRARLYGYPSPHVEEVNASGGTDSYPNIVYAG